MKGWDNRRYVLTIKLGKHDTLLVLAQAAFHIHTNEWWQYIDFAKKYWDTLLLWSRLGMHT